MRAHVVGSMAGAWANQALDYALNTDSPYVAVAYLRPPPGAIYDPRSKWIVYAIPSRQDLDAWYQAVIAAPLSYHYAAEFDKSTPEWRAGRAVAASAEPGSQVSGDRLQELDTGPIGARSSARRTTMSAHGGYVGADGGSYPEVGSRAVRGTSQQNPSPAYGYFRAGSQQKIYLFGAVEEARGWLTSLVHGQAQPYDYAAVFAAADLSRPVSGLESYGHTTVSGGAHVGADGGSYPEVASRAVRSASQQNPSPVYGYHRAGSQQKIYLFGAFEDARGWLTALVHGQQPYDYAAVFAAADLSRPVSGLESFGHATVSGDAHVGSVLPFLLGLPLGALGGYFYRGWQDKHPGHWIPGISGDHSVGGPWVDMTGPQVGGPWVDMTGPQVGGPWVDMTGPQVGGPWVDMTGPQVGGPWVDMTGPQVGGPWVDMIGPQVGAYADDYARRRAWPQTRALIESAKREAIDAQATTPAVAWVWSLDPSGAQLIPFSSIDQAQAYMFERIQTPHAALALFDPAARGHWPNPVRWTKSDDPAYEWLIAQRVAQYAPARAAGDYVGAIPWTTTIGTALDDVRSRAQTLANKRAGRVIGVIHTTKDNLWHALAFRNEDDADDWLGTATHDAASYTYAAYYDKDDVSWPHPVNEQIGGGREPSQPGAPIRRGPATTSGDHHHHTWWAA